MRFLQTRSRLAIAAFALLAIASCRKAETPEERLRDALSGVAYRPVALRLSGFDYAPPAPVRRGERTTEDAAVLKMKSAALAVANEQTAASTRAAALVAVGQLERAIGVLEEAIRSRPTATLCNDLAVLLYELGATRSDTELLAQALSAADHALRLDANLAEARFNRAAVLQALGWHRAAKAAWQTYLSADRDGAWTEEARARVERIPEKTDSERWPAARQRLEAAALAGRRAEVLAIAREFPQQIRTAAEGPYLADWGAAHLAGNRDEARRALTFARAIGDATADNSGERLVYDSVRAIYRQPDILARGHTRYREARLLVRERRVADALPVMQEAEDLLRSGGSPLALVAAYYRAGALFDLNRPVEAHALLDALTQRTLDGYIALRAQILWEKAMRAARAGESYASLRPNAEAIALFSALRETDNHARVLANRAATLTSLGRDNEAWQLTGEFFGLAGRSGTPDVVEVTLHVAGFGAMQQQRFDVAHSLFTLLFDSQAQSPVRRFDAALLQTFSAIRMGIASSTHLHQLERAAHALRDEELRQDALDELNYVQALLERDHHPADAAAKLSRSIAHRERKQLLTVAETYAARASALRRAGDTMSAIRDFAHALSIYEKQSGEIDETTTRDTFFGTAESVCRDLFSIQIERRLDVDAFSTAERCRARVLADVASRRRSTPTAAAEAIREGLTAGKRLIHYTVLNNETIVFVVSRDGFRTSRLHVPARVIEGVRDRLLAAADQQNETLLVRSLAELHALILAPLQPYLGGASELVIVPDETLAGVPFAALRDARGRYVVEDHAVVIAPNAALHVKRAAGEQRERSKAAIVADPAFDAAVTGSLNRLPHARHEGAEVSRLYRNATLLAGTDATTTNFLAAARDSDVIHVASHALVSARDATQSVLALAPGEDDGLLTLDVIQRQTLARAPVVVLAACRSAVPARGRGSIRSFAFAFMAAGARATIASVWDIDDATSGAVSLAFHRHLREGLSATEALRRSQLEMLASNEESLGSVTTWGAFQVYGSD